MDHIARLVERILSEDETPVRSFSLHDFVLAVPAEDPLKKWRRLRHLAPDMPHLPRDENDVAELRRREVAAFFLKSVLASALESLDATTLRARWLDRELGVDLKKKTIENRLPILLYHDRLIAGELTIRVRYHGKSTLALTFLLDDKKKKTIRVPIGAVTRMPGKVDVISYAVQSLKIFLRKARLLGAVSQVTP